MALWALSRGHSRLERHRATTTVVWLLLFFHSDVDTRIIGREESHLALLVGSIRLPESGTLIQTTTTL
jgi:hypothetical protein